MCSGQLVCASASVSPHSGAYAKLLSIIAQNEFLISFDFNTAPTVSRRCTGKATSNQNRRNLRLIAARVRIANGQNGASGVHRSCICHLYMADMPSEVKGLSPSFQSAWQPKDNINKPNVWRSRVSASECTSRSGKTCISLLACHINYACMHHHQHHPQTNSVRNKRHFACAALLCDDVNSERDVMACIPDCRVQGGKWVWARVRSIDQELVASSRHKNNKHQSKTTKKTRHKKKSYAK